MDYVNAFLCGGLLCAVGQIIIDKTKLTPARILVGYVVAAIFTVIGILTDNVALQVINFAAFKDMQIFAIPDFTFIEAFKGVKDIDGSFIATIAVAYVPVAFVVFAEHIADHKNISSIIEKDLLEEPGLHRTLLGDGLATSIASLFGAPANTTYGENTGVLSLSKVFDPKVVRIAAYLAVLVSFSPKFAALVSLMPTATIGGASLVLYGMISAIGVRNVVENKVDFTKSRNLVIAAVILVCGLGFSGGLTFTVAGTSITLTGLALAAIAGVILNAILPGNDYVFGAEKVNIKKNEH